MNRNTEIFYDGSSTAVHRAIGILKRDMEKVFLPTKEAGGRIRLLEEKLPPEQFRIEEGDIYAGDELGFVYGLLHISEQALAIPPFWFWYDHEPVQKDHAEIMDYVSKPARVKYRGWFMNDEILLNHWSPDDDPMTTWEMAYEALLRCGGNLVIPTTQVSRPHQKLAAEYGLWMTHHHGEPLGAEMFLKVYPGKDAAYAPNADKYEKLWIEGIEAQKAYKVVWTIGFRGQGDRPFWEDGDNSAYDTDEKRGKMIGDMIRHQYDMLHERLENPVCCTYIYGETAELYAKGYVDIPEDVIRIWADNGYGKMVSRRMELSNPRIPAFPDNKEMENGRYRHGIYYHVSYCDLRSCAHLTQIGNSNAFLERELKDAFAHGEDELLVVNCSNIRPHVYPLAMIAKIWQGEEFDSCEFGRTYFGTEKAIKAYEDYAKYAVPFGEHEDEHVGDHFYNFNVRNLVSAIMRHEEFAEALEWATGRSPLKEQVKWFADICRQGISNFKMFLEENAVSYGKLHNTTIMLHGKLHYHGFRGGVLFSEAYEQFAAKEYLKAFYYTGLAAEEFDLCNRMLRDSEYGVWKDYYANDCFADFKFTAYLLRTFMTYIRNYGEGRGFGFYFWQRELFYKEEDKGVVFQLNLDNRDTSEEMFRKMRDLDKEWIKEINREW